jgi:integrase
MKDKILAQFLSELDHSSPETQRVRRFWARRFLDFAPDDFTRWNRELVGRFQKQIEGERYAGGSVRLAVGIVKRVFDAAKAVHEEERVRVNTEIRERRKAIDLDDPKAAAQLMNLQMEADEVNTLPGPRWDVGKRAMPRVAVSDTVVPALAPDEVKKMVDAAKNGFPDGHGAPDNAMVAYLALSSIYGLRRGELCAVRPEHFDFSEPTLFVMTEKSGEQRKQLLAEPIIPYLKQYDFLEFYTPARMSQMFKRICYRSGVQDVDGEGWHAMRRSVETGLGDALAPLVADFKFDPIRYTKIFMRYKLSASGEMPDRYYTKNRLEVDRFIIENAHPALAFWA